MGVQFNLIDEDKKGVGREGYIEFLYLLMLIKLWTGDWKTQLKRMTQNVDEYNGKEIRIGNGQYQNICWFSIN